MVVSYISCYISNDRQNTILKKNKVYRGDEELLRFHGDVDNIRNKIVAHNGHILDKTYIEDRNGSIRLAFHANFPYPNDSGIEAFERLLNISWMYVHNKLLKITDELRDDIGIKVYIEDDIRNFNQN